MGKDLGHAVSIVCSNWGAAVGESQARRPGPLQNEHRVAKAVEAVLLLHRLLICPAQ
jgi:hypothetical protein